MTGTLTNNAGASLTLVDNPGDVANVHTLTNSGTIYIGRGTVLNLTALGAVTNSGNVGSSAGPGMVTNNGTLTVGSGNKFDANGTLTNLNSTTNTLTGGARTSPTAETYCGTAAAARASRHWRLTLQKRLAASS